MFTHHRRARKHNLEGKLTTAQWKRCLQYWDHRCAVCGRQAGLWHVLAQEHWIAIADPRPDNPGDAAWNVLPMCHSKKDGSGGCNNSKGKTDPLKWLYRWLPKKKADEVLKHIEAYFEWVKQQSND